jgi:threonine/homoserine/homoserine lactone efflux protein
MLFRRKNMDAGLFIRSLFIGLSVAATIGPMSILCMQRTMSRGFLYGLISGLGIATADGLYGSVAGLGLTVIASFLVSQQTWIHLLGGLFLLYLGGKTMLTKPAERAAQTATTTNSVGAYVSTLLLTLTNPLTIISFAAIFASLGVGGRSNSTFTALLVIGGVFLGSMLWWCLLTGGISLLRGRFSISGSSRWLLWLNRISGGIIMLFGLLALFNLR